MSKEATEVKVDCWGRAREASKEDKQASKEAREKDENRNVYFNSGLLSFLYYALQVLFDYLALSL